MSSTIIGAGYLGSAIARVLDPPIIATTRSGMWRHGSKPRQVELRKLDIVLGSAEEIGVAIGSSRKVIVCYSSGGSSDRRALYVDGGRRLAQALTQQRHERVVYVSSTSALPDLDQWLDEECPIWPQTERGRIQREAESIFIDRCTVEGIPWAVLRLAGLYGPGRPLARIYGRGDRAPLEGDGMSPTNLIHRDDAVAAVAAAVKLPRDCSAIIHVCDDDHTPRRQMYDRIAEIRGTSPPRWAREPAAGAPPRGKRVINDKMKSMLGITLLHPLHEFAADDDEVAEP